MQLLGIDAMAAMTAFEWVRIARWLEKGAPTGGAVPPHASGDSGSSVDTGINGAATRAKQLRASADDADDRSTFAYFERLRPYVGAAARLQQQYPAGASLPLYVSPTAPSLSSPTAAGTGGSSVVSLTYSGPDELRAPLEGMLRAVGGRYGRLISVTKSPAVEAGAPALLQNATRAGVHRMAGAPTAATGGGDGADGASVGNSSLWEGSSPLSYYGSALATGDFDGDGTLDLAVGAYGTSVAGSTPHGGAVHIHYNLHGGNGTSTGRTNSVENTVSSVGNSTVVLAGLEPLGQFGRASEPFFSLLASWLGT
jgi:hypothetical protein